MSLLLNPGVCVCVCEEWLRIMGMVYKQKSCYVTWFLLLFYACVWNPFPRLDECCVWFCMVAVVCSRMDIMQSCFIAGMYDFRKQTDVDKDHGRID